MDYHIKPLGKKCAETGADLAPGTRVYSVLVEDEDGTLTRRDYSPAGWKGPPPHTIGLWRSVVPRQAETARQPLDPEILLGAFEQLTEEAHTAREKLRYYLALLLLQKRRLRLEGSRPENSASCPSGGMNIADLSDDDLSDDVPQDDEPFALTAGQDDQNREHADEQPSSDEEPCEYLQLVGSQGDGAYEVRDFRLSEAELKQVQQELYAYLAAEWGEKSGLNE